MHKSYSYNFAVFCTCARIGLGRKYKQQTTVVSKKSIKEKIFA